MVKPGADRVWGMGPSYLSSRYQGKATSFKWCLLHRRNINEAVEIDAPASTHP